MSDVEERLLHKILSYRHDPLGFVQFAFPWGKKGTVLENRLGPQSWQAMDLASLGGRLQRGEQKIRRATASGKGIGKSARVAWQALWGLSTCRNTRIRLTAGTDQQLKTTTMPELAKWFQMMICAHWFRFTATSIYVSDPNPEKQKQWRLDAIPWNENNPEAFAGLHNQGSRIVYIFDEASQIADSIWDTSEGIFTDADTEVIFDAYGNPTRSIGRFREISEDDRWQFRAIDSRTVEITDKDELDKQVIAYGGEDSDGARMFIRGLFPRVAESQFISVEIVKAARKNDVHVNLSDALVLGVDVARFGEDSSVICPRKGRDARSLPWAKVKGFDNVQVATLVAETHERYKADAIHVDGGGPGAGVVDILRHWKLPVREVQFGGAADRTQQNISGFRYANKRTEMWGIMREMLPGLAIPDTSDLEKQLTSALYGYRGKGDEIALIPKEIMKRQHGVPSPDDADALALTFAYPVGPRGSATAAGGAHQAGVNRAGRAQTEYDHLAGR